MSYDGIEIDMLSLGDADCILVTQWYGSEAQRVLIDGGNKGSTQTIIAFLINSSIRRIDSVICTHPHDDHVGGLVPLLQGGAIQFGEVWMHWPKGHIDMSKVERALSQTQGLVRSQTIRESLQTVDHLFMECQQRGIPVYEPFAGQRIGMLTVVGPTQHYYEECVTQFSDSNLIRASEAVVSCTPIQAAAETLLESMPNGPSTILDPNPQTTPENNSGVILCLEHEASLHLFTGDVGAQGLSVAANTFHLENCYWMQIPHHGSRRNITEALIQHFRPRTAFVSAEGNAKHPRRAVVNAFRRHGTRVYSTHYPMGRHLLHHCGITPDRPGYSTAIPLYEAE